MSVASDAPQEKTRRNRRNPEATRASILAAARVEFANKGLDGARVDQIARRAKANKQLVYYYFGSKEDLYLAALESTYAEIRERERELDLSNLPPRDAMVRLIDFSLEYLNDHREFIRMLADENAHGARHVRSSEMALKTNSPLLDLISETLDRGVSEGTFRKDIDPLELYVSIAGMTFFYFANGLTMSAIFGRDLTQRESIRSYRDHIVALTMNGLRP
jgi:TetR/AcrR family transcriptional regulator